MSLEQEAVATVEAAIPGVAPAKIALGAIAAIIGAALLAFVIWKVFFAEHAAEVKHDIAVAHTQANVSAAQASAGAAAANTVANAGARETVIRERTNTNYVEITKQPGASDPVSDAVDAAGRNAICLRTSAAGLPDCERLRQASP